MGRQMLPNMPDRAGKEDTDLYFPLFTALQVIYCPGIRRNIEEYLCGFAVTNRKNIKLKGDDIKQLEASGEIFRSKLDTERIMRIIFVSPMRLDCKLFCGFSNKQ